MYISLEFRFRETLSPADFELYKTSELQKTLFLMQFPHYTTNNKQKTTPTYTILKIKQVKTKISSGQFAVKETITKTV